jgi:hypothetical protein
MAFSRFPAPLLDLRETSGTGRVEIIDVGMGPARGLRRADMSVPDPARAAFRGI